VPHRKLQAGDEVFIRAVVVEPMSDCFKVRIEDQQMSLTTFVPAREIASFEDIPMMLPPIWRETDPPSPLVDGDGTVKAEETSDD
jgi:hypothetical protein